MERRRHRIFPTLSVREEESLRMMEFIHSLWKSRTRHLHTTENVPMERKYKVACTFALTKAYMTDELLHILPNGLTDVDHGGSTALHLAAEHNMAMCAVLIAAGANIDAKDNDGNTPLHIAVSHTQPDVVRLLLLAHADINATNNEGKTPVQLAADEVVHAVFDIIADAPQQQA